MCILSMLLGDPGLGKSQLLQAAASVSPRGIYVCGNATTNAGLTVAVVKDPTTSDYAFEAGRLSSSFFCFPFFSLTSKTPDTSHLSNHHGGYWRSW